MKTLRRGITLVEILVSLVILGIVAALVSVEFLSQNRSWKTESDKAAVGMMAKGVLDELTHSARLTGGGLPILTGGIKTWGSGPARVTFVTNETGFVGRVLGANSVYDPTLTNPTLKFAVDTAQNFAYEGYVLLNLLVPPGPGSHGASVLQTFTLGVKDRVKSLGSCGTDSLVLDGRPLRANNWDQATDVRVPANTSAYRLDSIAYFMSNDTLFIRRNLQDSTAYAIGVDTLNILYRHPGDNIWLDTLSPLAPANAIDQVRIHLVTRSLQPDPKLREQDSASRGFHFSTLESEVTLRNDSLVNR